MLFRNCAGFLALAVLCCSFRTSAAAENFNLNPISDSTVSSANPDSNYGLGGALGISANGLPKGAFQTVMKFDASAAKVAFDELFGSGAWTISSVSLKLNAANPNNPLFNAQAAGQISIDWMQDDSWAEGDGGPSAPSTNGITFNTLTGFLNNGSEPGGTFPFSGANSGSFQYALTPTAGLSDDLLNGNLLSLWMHAADSTVSYLFNSRNFGTVASRPQLTITAVPEPTTFGLLAIAMVACVRRGSRKTR